MIKELFYKWFDLDPPMCPTCEVLKEQLARSERERQEILHTVLWKDKELKESTPPTEAEMKPIIPQYIPWRVRQQMFEAEDRKKAELMRAKEKEMKETKTPVSENIAKLEEELGVKEA